MALYGIGVSASAGADPLPAVRLYLQAHGFRTNAEPIDIALTESSRALINRPLELAIIDGKPLFRRGVTLVYTTAESLRPRRRPVHPNGVRMLAVFSQPSQEVPLGLGHERRKLEDMHRALAADGTPFELRILQYGVTEQALQDALNDGDGWDVIHFSGHGGPGFLVLESPDAVEGSDVPADRLADMISVGRRWPRLVTLFACASAAETAAAARSWERGGFGWSVRDKPGKRRKAPHRDAAANPSAAVAPALAERLGCAVLAMRYTVADDFAASLAVSVYRRLFENNNPVTDAYRHALRELIVDEGRALCDAATPILVGNVAAASLRPLLSGPCEERFRGPVLFPGFPQPVVPFVGRVTVLARARSALRGKSGAVLLTGLPGIGKTACANELACSHMAERPRGHGLWYDLGAGAGPSPEAPAQGTLRHFLGALDDVLKRADPSGRHRFAAALDEPGGLAKALPSLTTILNRLSVFVVLDGVDRLLDAGGRWKDRSWQAVIDVLAGHGGESRLVLTSRVAPAEPPDGCCVLRVGLLSGDETVLLCHHLPALEERFRKVRHTEGALLVDTLATVLDVVEGHPALVLRAEALAAADPAALDDAASCASAAEIRGDSVLRPLLTAGAAGGEWPWADALTAEVRRAVDGLDEEARRLFGMLCGLHALDRTADVLVRLWPGAFRGDDGWQPPVHRLEDAGLLTLGEDAVVLPACVADMALCRTEPAAVAALAEARRTAAAFWLQRHDSALAAGQDGTDDARAALPYLVWLGDWQTAGRMAERILLRRRSPSVARALIPTLEYLVTLADVTPDGAGVRTLRDMARHLAGAEDAARVLATLADADDPRQARAIFIYLADEARRDGNLALALAHARKALGASAAILDPSPDEVGAVSLVLALMNDLGHHDEVLSRISGLLHALDVAERKRSASPDAASRVREALLKTQVNAAVAIDAHRIALLAVRALVSSCRRRGAGPEEIAAARLSACPTLLARRRYAGALAILRRARTLFTERQDDHQLARVLTMRADLERRRGRPENAIGFGRAALTHAYAAGHPDAVTDMHERLAACCAEDGDANGALCHRLTAAVLTVLGGEDRRRGWKTELRHAWTASGRPAIPGTPGELAACVGAPADLFDFLAHRASGGTLTADAALARVRDVLDRGKG